MERACSGQTNPQPVAKKSRLDRKRMRKSRFMNRTQAKVIKRDLDKKMVLLSGPRQVGNSYLVLL
jgi:predicted AAA+ superfamily ATPase